MGGYGSGRKNYQAKRLVEDSYCLSMKTIKEHVKEVDANGGMIYSSMYWSSGGERTADIRYKVHKKNSLLRVQLIYQSTHWRTKEVTKCDYPVEIQHTEPNFGGKRYWFICPLVVSGKACLKRVGKLYLPPESVYFGCRECHDLVYLSSRESHKWDNMWLGMGYDPKIGKMLEKRFKRGEW
ncbi:hypothetical protein KQH54_03670 [bacterium]|nr:hypothetical protein [bacterium]